MSLSKLKRYIFKPKRWILALASRGFFNFLSDQAFIKLRYYCELGIKLDLSHPKTFSEKMQWLKLHDRHERYIQMVDKYAVKEYAANLLGEEYVIPTLGVWDSFDEINFDRLPNKFVLKCTHDSGGVAICTGKATWDQKNARKKLQRSLNKNFYWTGREWPYKNVPPRIIAEPYLEDEKQQESGLQDYKIYCFEGKPQYCQLITNRFSEETVDFYDLDWTRMEFTGVQPPFKPGAETAASRPVAYGKMQEIARTIAKGTHFVRVDFYEIDGELYFGEITFYPASGFGGFKPERYNEIMGDKIQI